MESVQQSAVSANPEHWNSGETQVLSYPIYLPTPGAQHLVPDFSGIAPSFSPFSLMLATSLVYVAFTICRDEP